MAHHVGRLPVAHKVQAQAALILSSASCYDIMIAAHREIILNVGHTVSKAPPEIAELVCCEATCQACIALLFMARCHGTVP